MWRGALILGLLLIGAAAGSVFQEGGGRQIDPEEWREAEEEMERQQYLMDIMAQEARKEKAEKEMADELLEQERLEKIMEELQNGYEEMKKELAEQELKKEMKERDVSEEQVKVAPVAEKPAPIPKQEESIDETAAAQPTAAEPTAQKKGQSEFVSFIDPAASKLTKDLPSLEKRTLNQVRVERLSHDSSLLYLAVGTVMIVGMLGGAIGGAVFYRRRSEEPDDQEYAPYAGTGPRSKKPIKGEKGDDALAYKAQLHHYQQAKQKIICGEDNAGVAGETDEETDEVDDEHNFSVYECPGLAPTGDIEVHNPNFAADPRP